jgi:hypothetical protein
MAQISLNVDTFNIEDGTEMPNAYAPILFSSHSRFSLFMMLLSKFQKA